MKLGFVVLLAAYCLLPTNVVAAADAPQDTASVAAGHLILNGHELTRPVRFRINTDSLFMTANGYVILDWIPKVTKEESGEDPLASWDRLDRDAKLAEAAAMRSGKSRDAALQAGMDVFLQDTSFVLAVKDPDLTSMSFLVSTKPLGIQVLHQAVRRGRHETPDQKAGLRNSLCFLVRSLNEDDLIILQESLDCRLTVPASAGAEELVETIRQAREYGGPAIEALRSDVRLTGFAELLIMPGQLPERR